MRRIALGSFNSLYYTIEYPVSALNVSLNVTYFAYQSTSSHRNNRFILHPRRAQRSLRLTVSTQSPLFARTPDTTEPRTERIATSVARRVSLLPAHSQDRVQRGYRAGHDIQHGA